MEHSLKCLPSIEPYCREAVPYSKLLSNEDKALIAKYKSAMFCKKCSYIPHRAGHYHCRECRTYYSYKFPRLLKHGIKCRETIVHDSETLKIGYSSDSAKRGAIEQTDGEGCGG